MALTLKLFAWRSFFLVTIQSLCLLHGIEHLICGSVDHFRTVFVLVLVLNHDSSIAALDLKLSLFGHICYVKFVLVKVQSLCFCTWCRTFVSQCRSF